MPQVMGTPGKSLLHELAQQVFEKENSLYIQAYEEAKQAWPEYAFKRFLITFVATVGVIAMFILISAQIGDGFLLLAAFASIAIFIYILGKSRKVHKEKFEEICRQYPFTYDQVNRFIPMEEVESEVFKEFSRIVNSGGHWKDSWLAEPEPSWVIGALGEVNTSRELIGLPDEVSIFHDLMLTDGEEKKRILANIDHYVLSGCGSIMIDSKVWKHEPTFQLMSPGLFSVEDEKTASAVMTCIWEIVNSGLDCDVIVLAVGGNFGRYLKSNNATLVEVGAVRNHHSGNYVTPRENGISSAFICPVEDVCQAVQTINGYFAREPRLHYESVDDVLSQPRIWLSTDPSIDLANTVTSAQLNSEAATKKAVAGAVIGAASAYAVKKYRDKHQ